MVFLDSSVLDNGLAVLSDNADRIDICSQEPATYTEATSTYSLGFKDHGVAGSSFGAPEARSPSGRKVASTAVTDGAVTGAGTATHYGVSDTANSLLVATNSLSAGQAVTSGNSWSMASFDIGLPGPS